jgi:hypothetical protein
MKIEVLQNFGGVETGERRILPGIYTIDDPRLFGCGQLLLDYGMARTLDRPTPIEEPPVPDRDTIMQALDTAGIEYSKYWTTDKLQQVLNDVSSDTG